MSSSNNIRYLFVIAISIGVVFAITAPKLLPSADARSDYCKQGTGDLACQKDSGFYLDKIYKCIENTSKDGVVDPKELERCRSK